MNEVNEHLRLDIMDEKGHGLWASLAIVRYQFDFMDYGHKVFLLHEGVACMFKSMKGAYFMITDPASPIFLFVLIILCRYLQVLLRFQKTLLHPGIQSQVICLPPRTIWKYHLPQSVDRLDQWLVIRGEVLVCCPEKISSISYLSLL